MCADSTHCEQPLEYSIGSSVPANVKSSGLILNCRSYLKRNEESEAIFKPIFMITVFLNCRPAYYTNASLHILENMLTYINKFTRTVNNNKRSVLQKLIEHNLVGLVSLTYNLVCFHCVHIVSRGHYTLVKKSLVSLLGMYIKFKLRLTSVLN